MKLYRKIFFLFIGLSLLFCACLNLKQPRNKIEFYTLEYHPPQLGDLKPLPFVIRLERFIVAPTYDTNRIIYRDQSFKRDAYAYYKWRANPGDLITHFLNRDIRHSGLFKAVLPFDSRSAASHMLEGTVDEFFEWDTKENWKAVLSISIILMADTEPDISKRIIFQKSYRATSVCQQKHPRALAKSMSQAMEEISGQIIKNIYSYLRGGI
ncbi:MAG: membrane integrity-associated transporter subunit PqiC [Deltaproteobacteria bacterium]|nr:membrane integrity-associated transporter subunit PqiC [Deltaproteobacteria bacterium]